MVRISPRSILVAVLAGLGGGAVVISASASAIPSAHRQRPHLGEREILRIALQAALASGDPTPRLIQHSEGTRSNANLVASGAGVPGRRWSYLIAERGHFIFRNASRPPGAPAPRGSVIAMIVDAATGDVTDTGISDRYPHLRALGRVRTDRRHALPPHARSASAYGVGIQAVLDRRDNPVLVANFTPVGSRATASFSIWTVHVSGSPGIRGRVQLRRSP